MLSYARNAEDVVLARVFEAQPSGFYIDVGASHPELGSVTKHFYDRGWCGVNVALTADDHARLSEARPRDVTLRLALADQPGLGCRYEAGAGELLTFGEVCTRYAPAAVDFLRVEAKGREAEVVRTGDWKRDRPRLLLIAESEPGSPESSEALLVAARYQPTLFDGLNRFYVRAEDAALRPRLAVSASAHEGREPHWYVSKITELERHAAALQTEAEKRGRYAMDLQEHLDRCQQWSKILERKVRRLEEHLGILPGTLPAPRPRYTAEDFVRFLYAVLVNRTAPPGPHVAEWADRLPSSSTMLDLLDAFLATPDGEHAVWIRPHFQRSQIPQPAAVAAAGAEEPGVSR